MDGLINERNQKIEDFMDALRDLEKQRTMMIQNCYKRYIVDIKQQPGNSLEILYKKYLKVKKKHYSYHLPHIKHCLYIKNNKLLEL